MVNLETNNYVKQYDEVSEDIKFVSKSLIRLKVLNILYGRPMSMKDISEETQLNYSSISTTLHKLELEGMVCRKANRYYLVASMRMQMNYILNLSALFNLVEEIFNIIEGHVVDSIPEDSVLEMHMLFDVELVESDGINPDMVFNLVESKLDEAESAVCILPVFHEKFNSKLNEMVAMGKAVEVSVSESILDIYEERSEVKYMSSFEGKNNFLLIVTDSTMLLGFFKEDNVFDKNRILVSSDEDSLRWANNLVKNFKKLNK